MKIFKIIHDLFGLFQFEMFLTFYERVRHEQQCGSNYIIKRISAIMVGCKVKPKMVHFHEFINILTPKELLK